MARPFLVEGHRRVNMAFSIPYPVAQLIIKESKDYYGGKKSPFMLALLCEHFNLDENYKKIKK